MKITYFELLEKVFESNQPKKVKVGSALYEWDGSDYILTTDSRRSLSDTITSWTTKGQTTAEFIEVVQEVLTDEEKAYLSAVIKPFKEDVSYIVKFEYQGFEYIRIVLRYDSINFPIFEKGKMYKGMEKAKRYTLEEIGL